MSSRICFYFSGYKPIFLPSGINYFVVDNIKPTLIIDANSTVNANTPSKCVQVHLGSRYAAQMHS